MNTKLFNKRKFVDTLKEANSLEELNSILADTRVPLTKDSGNRFSDDKWLVRKSKDTYVEIDFSTHLDPFPMAVCKVYFLLKAYGYIGRTPHDAAQIAMAFRRYSKKICELQAETKSLLTIQKKDIDLFIHNRSNVQEKTIFAELQPFYKAANLVDIIPKFLRMSKAAFMGPGFQALQDTYLEKERLKGEGGAKSPRPPYPFEDLSIMMPVAFELIENGNNLLDLLECLTNIDFFDTSVSESDRYTSGYRALKALKKETNNPEIDAIIREVKATKSPYIYYKDGRTKGYSVKKMRSRIGSQVALVESACTIVALILSAMRRGELSDLSRQFKIDSDDDMRLHKIIYKTSTSLSGDEHIVPMPEIGANALKLLSRLAVIRDGQDEGSIVSLTGNKIERKTESDTQLIFRVNDIVKKLPESLGLTHLAPHQLRHIMAYLVMQVVGKEGLEVVRYLLGHSSVLMTLTYLSRINPFFREVLEEVSKKMSKENLEALYLDMEKGKKVYGVKAAQFNGVMSSDMIDVMFEYWGDKIEQGWMMVLLTPMAMCIHDLNRPGEMKCQRGLDNSDLAGVMPAPSRCDPSGCSSAIYLEDHVLKVMALAENAGEELQNDEMFKRLGENLYFNPNDFSIIKESGYKSIIDEYKEDQRRAI